MDDPGIFVFEVICTYTCMCACESRKHSMKCRHIYFIPVGSGESISAYLLILRKLLFTITPVRKVLCMKESCIYIYML